MFALGGEGRHELERVVASDYSRAQISVKLAVDQLRSRARSRSSEAERMAKSRVRRHRHLGD